MNKTINLIACAIGGIILAVLADIIVPLAKDKNTVILGWTCGIAGGLTLIALIAIGLKLYKNKKNGERVFNFKDCTQFIRLLVFGLCMALAGLVIFALNEEGDKNKEKPVQYVVVVPD